MMVAEVGIVDLLSMRETVRRRGGASARELRRAQRVLAVWTSQPGTSRPRGPTGARRRA